MMTSVIRAFANPQMTVLIMVNTCCDMTLMLFMIVTMLMMLRMLFCIDTPSSNSLNSLST